MAGGTERLLKRRIRTVQSTQKITRAMELIAASRIVRAQAAVAAAQPYSEAITSVIRDLAEGGGQIESPLLQPREEIRRVAHIVVAADRGLCGGYNSSVIRAAEASLREVTAAGRDYSLLVVGRKAEGSLRYRGYRLDASFTGFSDKPSYDDARRIGEEATAAFVSGETDRVEIIYTQFVSIGRQEVVRETLIPLQREAVAEEEPGLKAAYEFEPGTDEILDLLLPRYVDSRIYAALLNGAASEHAARQRAMKAATDNADDLITTLTRGMNRARQDAITTEIMEIVGGAEALRKAKQPEPDLLIDTIEGRRPELFTTQPSQR
jgi:F-type H+-transporting ATPase subunit gamma